MASHQLIITLPDSVFEEVEKFKKMLHKKSTEDTIAELIKYALTLPPYFKDFDWTEAEKEADSEIASGKTDDFKSVDDFLADLKK